MAQPSLKQISGLNSALAGKVGTASNVGNAGVGIFKQKNGTNLEFNNLVAGTAINTLTADGNNNITIGVNVGTSANQVVQLDGNAKLPAVDGSALTNLPTGVPSLPTGQIFVGNGSNNAQAVAKNTVLLNEWGEPNGNISMGAYKITTSASSFSGNELVTKTYVDSVATAGTHNWKTSVKVVTTSNVTLSAPGSTLDGRTMAVDERFLAAGQTNTAENGLYLFKGSGAAAVRAADADTQSELQGLVVFVEEGTNADSIWRIITDGTITVGTTALSFTKMTSVADIVDGNGLTKSANTLSVNTSGVTTGIVSDNVIVRSSGTANQVMLSSGSDGAEAAWGSVPLTDSNAVSGTLPTGRGGTGISSPGANTFLVCTTAGTWTTLALGANNMIGRKSSGNLAVLNGGDVRTISGTNFQVDRATMTAGNMVLITLSYTPTVSTSLCIFYRGIMLDPTNDYTVSGTTVTATSALNVEYGGAGTDGAGFATGDVVTAVYIR